MKTLFLTLVALTLSVLGGCNQGTPGGPGATGKRPGFGQADDTFNLTAPSTWSSLQQGEEKSATIGIKRAKNFHEDVAIKFANVPAGLTIEPAAPVIKHGDTDVKLTVKAANEAPPGEFAVKITGHPASGGDAEIVFNLTIAAKDTFTLSPPRMSVALKQGEQKMVAIGIVREKTFALDVAVKFAEMPTGVTLEPSTFVIKPGDAEARVTIMAANDASLGNFAVKVVGHPTQGADATTELRFTVAQK